MSGPHMTVHVTHVDDSVRGRLVPYLNFWGITQDRILNLQLLERCIEIIRPILESNPPPLHQSVLVEQICCVLINHRWLRARVTDLQLNPTGSLEVLCVDSGATHSVPLAYLRKLDIPGPEAECVREWLPLASRYILADVVSPQTYAHSMQKVCTQWSDSAMMFLKIHVENRPWRAVYQGLHGGNQCLRLYDNNNQLLATKMIQQGLGAAAQTYFDALSSCEEKDLNPNLVKSLNALSAGFNFSPQQPQFVMPQNYLDQPSLFSLAALPTAKTTLKPPRAYVTADLPGKGRHDVIVTSILEGPFKFTIQRNNDAEEFRILRKKLESVVLRRFLGPPSLGAPCIAVNLVDKLPYRGLITHIVSSNQLSVYFVDVGTTEIMDISQLYEISDELVAARLTVSRVSLIGAEEVAKLPGIHQIFTAMVKESLYLQCEVVENDGKPKINLYDHTGRSFKDILLAMYSNFRPISPTSVMSNSRPGSSQSHIRIPMCLKEIPPVIVTEEEGVCVTYAEDPGSFFGQLEKISDKELDGISLELEEIYSAEKAPPLLYADVSSHLGEYAVHQWAEDKIYYRVKILEELINDAQVIFVDYGNSIRVPRSSILAPFENLGYFRHPPFAIHCKFEGDVNLPAAEWKNLVMDKSLRVKVSKCVNNVYSVTLTDHPCNFEILKAFVSKVSHQRSVTPPNPAQTESKATRTNDDRRKGSNNGLGSNQNTRSGYTNYIHPNASSKDSKWRSVLGSTSEEVTQPTQLKTANKDTNWRSSANPVQEVIRAPRGPPPSDGNEETKGPTGFQRQGLAEKSKPSLPVPAKEMLTSPVVVDKPQPVPTPIIQKEFSYLPSIAKLGMTKPVNVCYIDPTFSFYVQFQESCSVLDDLVARLNAVYSDESMPTIQQPKPGLPCVVKYEDDQMWYRGQIINYNAPIANVWFVDYGNTQRGSIKSVKAITEEFVKLPPQAIHCRLSGVGRRTPNVWTPKEKEQFENDFESKTLIAKLASIDSDKLRDLETFRVRLIDESEGRRVIINEIYGAPSSSNVLPPDGPYTPLPTSETPIDVSIAWFYNPMRFFVSPVDLSAYQTELDELEEFYASLSADELREDKPKVGLPCVVKYTGDQCYYRSKIISVRDQMAEVLFIDYGNKQDTPLSELKRIVPRFMKCPQLTWQSRLKDVKVAAPLKPELLEHASSCFLTGETVSARFHPGSSDGFFYVDLTVPKIGDVSDYLVARKVLERVSTTKIEIQLAHQKMDFASLETISTRAISPYVNNPKKFWVQLEPELVDNIMERLVKFAAGPEFLNSKDFVAAVGKPCLAFFSEDGCWYRARVEALDGDRVTVYYIDYGNESCVKRSDLRSLPEDFARQPALAYRCCLEGIENFSEDVAEAFNDRITTLVFTVKCFRIANGILFVGLYTSDGVDLYQQICNQHVLSLTTIQEVKTEAEEDVTEFNPSVDSQSTPMTEESKGMPGANLPDESIVKDFPPESTSTPAVIEVQVVTSIQEPELTSTPAVIEVPVVTSIQEPQTNTELEVYVVFTKSPSQFWVQMIENEDNLMKLQDELFNLYEGNTATYHFEGKPIVDRVYGVHHPVYETWFRAQITEVLDDTVEAFFVDYGDTHLVPMANLRTLPVHLAGIPQMAIQSSLKKDPIDWSQDSIEKFNQLCIDPAKVCRVCFQENQDGIWFASSLSVGDENVTGLISIVDQKPAVEAAAQPDLDATNVVEDDVQPAVIVDSDLSIVVEQGSVVDTLEGTEPPTLMLHLEDFDSVGIPSIESAGHVLEAIEETPCVEQEASEVSKRVEVKPSWNFVDQVPAMDFDFTPGQNISSMASVQHVESALEIWIQLVPSAVDELMEQVAQTDVAPFPILKPKIGRHCLALFPDDAQWYRAVVDNIIDDEATVTYIDYGNSSKVDLGYLRALPRDLAQQPGLAIKCALDGAERNVIYSPTADQCDVVLTDEILTVVYVSQTQDHLFVRLYDPSGNDLNEKLGLVAVSKEQVVENDLLDFGSISDDVAMTSPLPKAVEVVETTEPVTGQLETSLHEIPEVGAEMTHPVVPVTEDTSYANFDALMENLMRPYPEHTNIYTHIIETYIATAQQEETTTERSMPLLVSIHSEPVQSLVDEIQVKQEPTWEHDEVFHETDADVVMLEASYLEVVMEKVDENAGQLVNELVETVDNDVEKGQVIHPCSHEDLPPTEPEEPTEEAPGIVDVAEDMADISDAVDLQQDAEPATHDPSIANNPDQQSADTSDRLIADCPDQIVFEESDYQLEESMLIEMKTEVKTEVMSNCDKIEEDEELVYISYIESPGMFWIQEAKNEESIGDIDTQLAESGVEKDIIFKVVGPPVVGRLYAVNHPEYDNWYRAKLLRIEGDNAVVSFVDYGDRQTVPFSSIREMPKLLALIPSMAVESKLAAVHLDHWPQKAIDVMKEMCPPESKCKAVFRTQIGAQSDDVLEVQSLVVGDANVVDLVLASLVCSHHLDKPSESAIPSNISPVNDSLYIPPAQIEAQFCLIHVEAESDSMETGPDNNNEDSNFLSV